MGGFGISGQSISGGTKKKKYVDPRANATRGVYERHLADQARRKKVASSTVPSNPALRGGPSPVIASALQSVADRALLNQSARPVTTGPGAAGSSADKKFMTDWRELPHEDLNVNQFNQHFLESRILDGTPSGRFVGIPSSYDMGTHLKISRPLTNWYGEILPNAARRPSFGYDPYPAGMVGGAAGQAMAAPYADSPAAQIIQDQIAAQSPQTGWGPNNLDALTVADMIGGYAGQAIQNEELGLPTDPGSLVDQAPMQPWSPGTTAPPNPWLEKLASFGAEGDPAAEEARIAFAENLEIIDPLAAAKLREQVALNGIGNVNDPNVFQWNQGVGAAGNQIGLVPAGTPPPTGGPPPPGGTPPPPPPAGGPPPPVGGDMGVVGGGSPLDRQIGIVEEALSEREAAIQIMLDEGLIDIEAAQDLYDAERERVYEDFLAEQAGVITGFESDMATAQTERTADRDALNAQLIAAGIDPGLVADEFAMMDATYQGGRDAERDYLNAMGRIGTSADADRALLGEAVFGGFGQDLRSTAREMDLGAAMMAAEDRQTARERGLSSELLSPFTGVPEGAMFAGQYADVDTPSIQSGREQRASEERIALAESADELQSAIAKADADSYDTMMDLMSQGIDPFTGQLMPFDPDNPYMGLDANQRLNQILKNKYPYRDLLPTVLNNMLTNLEIDQDTFDTLQESLFDQYEGFRIGSDGDISSWLLANLEPQLAAEIMLQLKATQQSFVPTLLQPGMEMATAATSGGGQVGYSPEQIEAGMNQVLTDAEIEMGALEEWEPEKSVMDKLLDNVILSIPN